MAYFAQIDDDNNVIQVIVVNNEDCLDKNGNESEKVGIDFCHNLFGGKWLQTSFNRTMRVNFAGPGMKYFPELDAFMDAEKPYPWYTIGEDGRWMRPPEINDLTGKEFSEDELKYIAYYIRNTKSFRFCPAVPKDPTNTFLSIACTTDDFMYPTFEELMYGKSTTQNIAQAVIDGDKIIIPVVHRLRKDLELTPLGIILEVGWELLNIDIASDALNSHPQTAARTRQELFRLIIEWAYAYTHFENKEPAAETCHKILCVLQMPKNVRDDLLKQIEPQAVERYLRNLYPFKATSFEVLHDPPCPESFNNWYREIQEFYKEKTNNKSLAFDIKSIPNNYPV